ncbi:hypothetical protein [Thermosulfurimonas sp. F29]|uniref:hypothetical protein n=1 Tax=Thermosulfurimonas sp. F29 TaxID=2867247 RepID=UPI001C82FD06|nr:hypothetical protein [Thermosulfurimonas sp. F29]MBX6424123.1 hypothetical protein [Thermosulfurimonas sp. F29]
MLVLDLLKSPPLRQFAQNFRQIFPRFFAQSLDVQVAPWFPYSYLEQYDRRDHLNQLVRRIDAIAFPDARVVSFRFMPPDPLLLIHELGHVVFSIKSEPPWNSSYAGAEILFWLFYREILAPADLSPDDALEALVSFFKQFPSATLEWKRNILSEIVGTLNPPGRSLFGLYSTLGVLKPESFLEFPKSLNPNQDPPVNFDHEPDTLLRALLSGALLNEPACVHVLLKTLNVLMQILP